jgi:hypothetical protein
VLALTNMAMRSAGFDGDYVAAWIDALELDEEQVAVVTLYTAMHCADFLSEIGQRFNKDAPAPVDPLRIRHLQKILDDLLLRIATA